MKPIHLGPRQLGIFSVLFLFFLTGFPIVANEPAPTYEFQNGLWLNGQICESKTMYSVAGELSTKKPSRIDEQIDLAGA